jgi:metal-responsive CopG/Arc/MetJ family transcriptional regulator
MHSLEQLEKQQVGLRLPKYLIDEIDDFTQQYALNRTDIITEAIKSYIEEQKAKAYYESFDRSCKTLKESLVDQEAEKLQTLDELMDEL